MITELEPDVAWSRDVDDAPIALSAAGGVVAVAGAGGTAWVFDVDDGALRDSVTMPGGILSAELSPDGSRLALAGPGGHGLWKASTPVHVAETGEWSSAARWGSGTYVAFASGRRVVVLGTDGRLLWETAAAPSTVTDLAWLRDGRRVATAAYNGVRGYERHSRNPVVEYPYLGSHLALAASPTGRWVCSGNQDASIHIWRTRDGSDLTMHGYPQKISHLAFDDTGRWLATNGSAAVAVWDFGGAGPSGTRPRMLPVHEALSSFAWRTGNDGVLASAGTEGLVALWHATTGRPGGELRPACVRPFREPVVAMTWAGPDLLFLANREGRVVAWRLS